MITMKKITFSIMILLYTFILFGCSIKKDSNSDSKYSKWINELNINSYSGVSIDYITESDNSIEIAIECDREKEGYESLSKLVDVHNKFVRDNADYFPEGCSITFVAFFTSGEDFIYLYNRPSKEFGRDYTNELEMDEDFIIKYLYVDIWDFLDEFQDNNISFDVSVIVFTDRTSGVLSSDAYSILQRFNKLNAVIIDYHNILVDEQNTYKAVMKYAPDSKLYFVKAGELEEYIP